MSVAACRASTLTLCARCIALLLPPRPALADFTDLEVVERTDLPICQDPSEPEIPYKLDVCEVYAVFDDSADRLVSVAFSNVSTTAQQGFFQHTLGGNTAPACGQIALEPTLECDSFVTLGLDCFNSIDGSSTDPDFDSTGFNTSGEVDGGWYNIDPTNGQGAPDANGRVLIARFSYKQNKNTSGDVCAFTRLAGSDEITEFLLLPFDCSNPGMQGVGGGGAGAGCGGGSCLCTDIPFGGNNEPTLVVNPTDPLNIAVAWNPDLLPPDDSLAQLTISSDGGETWLQPIEAVVPPGFCDPEGFCTVGADPSIAFDSSGNLYWAYMIATNGPVWGVWVDIFVMKLDSDTGEILVGPVQVINEETMTSDKVWLAVDSFPTSPHADSLYLIWGHGQTDPLMGFIAVSHIDDLAAPSGWSAPTAISPIDGSDGFMIPSHIAVAGNGDVYAAYHSQTGFLPGNPGNPDGATGKVIVRRSTNGGVAWDAQDPSVAFGEGLADITWNYRNTTESHIPKTRFWLVGSSQPWVVPDPLDHSRIYIIAADDPPPNVHGDPDDSRIYIVRSDNYGVDWTAPMRIEPDNPENEDTFQVFPTAAIDRETGCLVVLWYDNRNDQTFLEDLEDPTSELFYLDVFFSISSDQGQSFGDPRQINDLPFDHVFGADWQAGVKRIGEYIGVALATDPASGTQHLYAAWTGNDAQGQQIIFDKAKDQCDACPWDLDDGGTVEAFDLAVLLGAWGTNPCGPPDFNGDGNVDAFDLAELLGHWGSCP